MSQLLISLISGLIGGNVAGGLLKKFSLGPVWNSILGILGGGLGGQLLGMITGAQTDNSNMIGNIISSVVGGGALMPIVGYIRSRIKTS